MGFGFLGFGFRFRVGAFPAGGIPFRVPAGGMSFRVPAGGAPFRVPAGGSFRGPAGRVPLRGHGFRSRI